MLIGLYGGTFDPFHKGHMHAALAVARSLDLAHIRLLLAARPRHRDQPRTATRHRWRMLQLACACSDLLVPDDREVRRQGATFTVDTLREIRASQPRSIPCWLLGYDAFVTLPSWKDWRSLLELCNLVVVDRPLAQDGGVEPEAITALSHTHQVTTLESDRVGQIIYAKIPMLRVSATEVRERVAQARDVEHLLVPPVYDYIKRHGLYDTEEKSD